jgi:hypothetical protein
MRIVSSHFVAGLVLKDEVVVRSAPILSYMIGWTNLKVEQYCNRKGWTYEYQYR